MCELLWSDPQAEDGRKPSTRGLGIRWGPDVSKSFLLQNKLDLIVRAHEVKWTGFDLMHEGKILTVFSAPNYCDVVGNQGAFLKFDDRLEYRCTNFRAVEHPPAQAMIQSNHL